MAIEEEKKPRRKGAHRGPRYTNRLTDQKCKKIEKGEKTKRYPDGACLFFEVSKTGAKHWIFSYERGGKRVELGLGGYPSTSLSEAREKAQKHRDALKKGADPKEAKAAASTPRMSFSQAYDAWVLWIRGTWRESSIQNRKNPFHRPGWKEIGDKAVADITADDLVEILKPLPIPTRDPMRCRFENVLDHATEMKWRDPYIQTAAGVYSNINPASLKILKRRFPQAVHVTKHRRPIGQAGLPAFVESLRSRTTIPRLALETILLTTSRFGTVAKATWIEIDWDAAIWNRPALHMKSKRKNEPDRVHRVPITPRLMVILRFLQENRHSDLIFPSVTGRILGNKAINDLMPEGADCHGLRTDFKTWSRTIAMPRPERDAIEVQMDHIVGNATEMSYLHDDLFEERIEIMLRWEAYLGPASPPMVLVPEREPQPKATKQDRQAYMRAYMQDYRAVHK